jgi:excisionase family DNA binding protein
MDEVRKGGNRFSARANATVSGATRKLSQTPEEVLPLYGGISDRVFLPLADVVPAEERPVEGLYQFGALLRPASYAALFTDRVVATRRLQNQALLRRPPLSLVHGALSGLRHEWPRLLPRLLTVREVAKILRVSRGTVYTLCRRRKLPHVRAGNSIRIPMSVLRDR